MQEKKRLEILGLLEQDARLAPEQIAAMVAEPADAVAAVVAELEAQRAIVRYTTLVDWDRAGV
ncbi:MAG TPA: Lrp/AsnC family transcriptional regulator, partial [Symbiobacteriaceae bacterium]|nr:Lrp/AsnC family transcriptional regulator [Symbiobacteriaceae bacterium]